MARRPSSAPVRGVHERPDRVRQGAAEEHDDRGRQQDRAGPGPATSPGSPGPASAAVAARRSRRAARPRVGRRAASRPGGARRRRPRISTRAPMDAARSRVPARGGGQHDDRGLLRGDDRGVAGVVAVLDHLLEGVRDVARRDVGQASSRVALGDVRGAQAGLQLVGPVQAQDDPVGLPGRGTPPAPRRGSGRAALQVHRQAPVLAQRVELDRDAGPPAALARGAPQGRARAPGRRGPSAGRRR